MESTRRAFVKQTLAATGGAVLCPLGCRWARADPRTAGEGEADRSFEPAYLRLERTGELARREEALWSIFSDCRCCPRECGARRRADERPYQRPAGPLARDDERQAFRAGGPSVRRRRRPCGP